jgi:hypothetical protein
VFRSEIENFYYALIFVFINLVFIIKKIFQITTGESVRVYHLLGGLWQTNPSFGGAFFFAPLAAPLARTDLGARTDESASAAHASHASSCDSVILPTQFSHCSPGSFLILDYRPLGFKSDSTSLGLILLTYLGCLFFSYNSFI